MLISKIHVHIYKYKTILEINYPWNKLPLRYHEYHCSMDLSTKQWQNRSHSIDLFTGNYDKIFIYFNRSTEEGRCPEPHHASTGSGGSETQTQVQWLL